MLVGGTFQVIFAGTAAGAYAAANHAVYHVHVAVAPAAQLFI